VSKFLDHDAALLVMADKMAELKPRLRGWLHAGSIPFVVAAGIVLIALSPSTGTKVGSAVFIASALLLFGVSAIYHRGTWQPAVWALLRRLDHSNIFILIAVRGGSGWTTSADQAGAVGEHDRLDPVPHPELGEDPRDVCLHGRLADDQPVGDLGVREPLGE